MRYLKMTVISAIIVMGLLSFAYAGSPLPANVSGSGSYNNNVSLLNDGNIPAEWTDWTAGTNVWWNGTTPQFQLDFGQTYHLEDMLVQVDNNDSYKVQYSLNATDWVDLFIISAGDGNVSYGMDTFYQSDINFASVDARYIKLFATGGDNCYAVSEIQAFGTSSNTVPEPTTMLLLGLGLIGLAGVRRRMQ